MKGDDDALLRRVARGDRAAFDEFYRRSAPWLAVRLRRRCSDDDIVAEVLQDSFLTVWQAAPSYVGVASGGSAAGWLWTIAARRLIDAFRRRARRPQPVAAGTDLVDAATSPAAEDEVVGPMLDDMIGGALCALAPELQAVLRAMVLDGLTVRETSALLGVPEGTVKTRARRARTELRRALS
jgi:RNA polymerase sigma-70 factor, ECF subfamily